MHAVPQSPLVPLCRRLRSGSPPTQGVLSAASPMQPRFATKCATEVRRTADHEETANRVSHFSRTACPLRPAAPTRAEILEPSASRTDQRPASPAGVCVATAIAQRSLHEQSRPDHHQQYQRCQHPQGRTGKGPRRAFRARSKQHAAPLTLNSISDAVISTEAMTGWSREEAQGQPIGIAVRPVNRETRVPVANAVSQVKRGVTPTSCSNAR